MLYVFTGVLQLPGDFLDTCSCFLPTWRLGQVNRYRFPADMKRCAMAYLLLVKALKNEGFFSTFPEFGYHEGGKPFLSNYQNLYFSLSHCHNTVACLLSGTEAGVDVECVEKYDDELARAACNDIEYRWVNHVPDPSERARRFTELWTRKESMMKWLGSGWPDDIREISGNVMRNIQEKGCSISSQYFREGNYYLSVCNTINDKTNSI